MTFGPRRLPLSEFQPPAPRRLPQPAALEPVQRVLEQRPQPDPGRALAALTLRPVVAQRQAVQAPLRAAALVRQEEGHLRQRRQGLEAELGASGPARASSQEPAQAPQRQPPGGRPQTPGDWVTALRDRAEAVAGRPLDARQAAQFTALQRQVAHTLAQGFRQDRRAPQERYGDYGDHLATLQRHPVSAPVAGVVLGLVPAAERPALQRAAAEGLERQLAQEEALARAGSRQTVQRQLDELDAEAGRPLLERIQARRGAGNPLPEAVRRHLEGGLNHDLARVRIHDDAEAHKLAKGVRALAFTTGTDIFFRRGHFDPNSRSGLELLAHEVTHTVQQSRGQVGGGVDPDAGLEAEARVMGARLAQVMPNPVMPSAKSLLPPVSPHAPGVYTPAAATARVQAGAAQRFVLKPLHDLQPRSVQRFDLGGALGAAWDATGGKVVEKGKELVASGLKMIPGYKELCLAFGRDLVTGQAVGGSAEGILTALTNWVPGPLKDILRALRETNVIGKAWEWFKGELGKLDLAGALGEIASAIGKADLGAAKSAVTRRIGGVKNLIVGSARKIAEIGLTALTAGLGPLGQQIMAKLKGAGDVIVQVLRDPVKFARNLISAVGGGFKAFGSNAPRHLQNGIGQWLTGASGITFPASFSLEGVFMTALSVMGLTYQAMRGKLVRALGPGGADKVGRAESTVQALQTMKGGLQHASEMKGEQGSVGKAVQDGIKSEVTQSLVLTGIQKLVTMLVPGGGFINAVIGAFQTVQTIVQQAAQIGQVVTNALGSVAAIAAGNISGAVGFIDRALGGAIPVALAWLGKLVGLGNLGGKIKNVINKVRGRLDRVVDKIVAKVKGIIEKVLGKGKTGIDKAKKFLSGLFGKKNFVGAREAHSTWVEVKNNQARIMIASTPMEGRAQLQNFVKAAETKLGNPDAVREFRGKMNPHLSYAVSQIAIQETALKGLTSSLPADERASKMQMDIRSSNITQRVANLGQRLLDETEKAARSSEKMREVTLTFDTGKITNGEEMRLQLTEQQTALNTMSAARWLARYPYYPSPTADKAKKREIKRLDGSNRQKFNRDEERALVTNWTLKLSGQYQAEGLSRREADDKAKIEAALQVTAFMKTQAALHVPDKIGGGHVKADLVALGDRDVNSQIGRQWKLGNKIQTIKAACEGIQETNRRSTYLRVKLLAT